MTKIKILVEGYDRIEANAEFASSTVTLIQENGVNVIVDPGMDKERLLSSLSREKLQTKDIDYVLLTHNHIDHFYLAGIFENAKIIDNESVYSTDGKIYPHDGKVPGTEVQILNTPGHDPFHCSAFVRDEKLGKVIVAGDLFWWKDGEKQEPDKENLIHRQDIYVKNEKQLKESRKMVLELADYIIPGHGKIFQVQP